MSWKAWSIRKASSIYIPDSKLCRHDYGQWSCLFACFFLSPVLVLYFFFLSFPLTLTFHSDCPLFFYEYSFITFRPSGDPVRPITTKLNCQAFIVHFLKVCKTKGNHLYFCFCNRQIYPSYLLEHMYTWFLNDTEYFFMWAQYLATWQILLQNGTLKTWRY
jgi:hypothetical protein